MAHPNVIVFRATVHETTMALSAELDAVLAGGWLRDVQRMVRFLVNRLVGKQTI